MLLVRTEKALAGKVNDAEHKNESGERRESVVDEAVHLFFFVDGIPARSIDVDAYGDNGR